MKKKARSLVKVRRRWRINPKTRVVKNRKVYSRKKIKKSLKIVIEGNQNET